MTSILPRVPAGCELVGAIHDNSDPDFLTQDMLEVYCPSSETLIRVGWMPEEDPSGQYFVAVYRDCERIRDVVRSRDADDIKREVERLASEFSRGSISYKMVVYVAGASENFVFATDTEGAASRRRELEEVYA